MTHTAFDFVFEIQPPWIYIGPGEKARNAWVPSHFYSRGNRAVCVRRLRGNKMRTTPALMNEFAAAFQFFDGFGENWYALEECLSYLDEWLAADAYVVAIEHGEELLVDEDKRELISLLKVLNSAGEYWSRPIESDDRFKRPSRPFHSLIFIPDKVSLSASSLKQCAIEAGVSIRVDGHM